MLPECGLTVMIPFSICQPTGLPSSQFTHSLIALSFSPSRTTASDGGATTALSISGGVTIFGCGVQNSDMSCVIGAGSGYFLAS